MCIFKMRINLGEERRKFRLLHEPRFPVCAEGGFLPSALDVHLLELLELLFGPETFTVGWVPEY